MGDECRHRAHSCSSGRRFGAGVAAANDYDVKSLLDFGICAHAALSNREAVDAHARECAAGLGNRYRGAKCNIEILKIHGCVSRESPVEGGGYPHSVSRESVGGSPLPPCFRAACADPGMFHVNHGDS